MKCAVLFIVILFAESLHWTTGQTNDYCSRSLCSGLTHIACGNSGGYGSRCQSDASELYLGSNQQDILHRINTYRNEIAGGNNPRYHPAVRMATMVWDQELEYMAYLNAVSCDFNHDDCRNTGRFRNSGQNIAWRWDPPSTVPNAREAVLWAIDYWYSEHTTANSGLIDSYYTGTGNEHFLVMVAERNIATGCAALQQSDNGGTFTYVVCNYATTNIIDRPIYRSGATASRCREGVNPEYRNLCEITERYSVNSNRW